MSELLSSSSRPRIRRLARHEAERIAAGEVVERPVSVVKELIENALDAHATVIELRFKDSGRQSIRSIDNGYGMSLEDARLCTVQYATSKISSVDELSSLATFGFRGEALASIRAVSRLTLITKDALSREGIRLSFNDHENVEEPVAAQIGTDITVDDLFYNVPARKKFLKKGETEWRHIMMLIHALLLSHCDIHVTVVHDGDQILSCAPTDSLIQRMAHLWGAHTAQYMLTIAREHSAKNIRIYGAVSNHQYSKFDRSAIFFFVNNRWVKNTSLAKAVMRGYQNVLPPGRYPVVSIHIDVDPATIDVNIHPRKEEVQFLHPQIVETLVQSVIKEALEAHISAHIKQPVTLAIRPEHMTFHTQERAADRPFMQELVDISTPVSRLYTIPEVQPVLPSRATRSNSVNEISTSPISEPFIVEQSLVVSEEPKIAGYFNKTYILVERDEGLFIVDQHAAHERILYEQFVARAAAIETFSPLFPITMHSTSSDSALLDEHADILRDAGIMLELCGENQLRITVMPLCLKNGPIIDIVRSVTAWLVEERALPRHELHALVTKKLYAQMACKAAVKAGDALDEDHMKQLLKDLQKVPNRFTCPHGRPTGWLISLYEIEKKFKRRS